MFDIEADQICLKHSIIIDLKFGRSILFFRALKISLGKFPANSNLCTKLTESKSSGKSSSELFVLAPDWSEFERKCV